MTSDPVPLGCWGLYAKRTMKGVCKVVEVKDGGRLRVQWPTGDDEVISKRDFWTATFQR